MKIFLLTILVCVSAFSEDKSGSQHWSFKSVVPSAVPSINDAWIRTPIDSFILEKLQKVSLKPSAMADKKTLIRRAYFDLTGLPPTYDDVQKFVNDDSPEAWEKLIDRLLASPRYGERWARHWLDVARYADTRGYLTAGKDTTFPFAYTYRDYVIKAFNSDKPYNQFIIEQIAADLLDLKGHKKELAALGFLTAGERFLNKRDEIINDRIDVVTQGFLGLTVACARCHDHKFDPVPAADYYSLYGIFNSTHEPKLEELPVIGEIADKNLRAKYEKDLAAAQNAVVDQEKKFHKKFRSEWPVYIDGIVDYAGKERYKKVRNYRDYKGRALRKGFVKVFNELVADKESANDAFYGPLHRIWHAKNDAQVEKIVKESINGSIANELKKILEKRKPKTRLQVFEVYRDLLNEAFAELKSKKWDEIRNSVDNKRFEDLYFSKDPKIFIGRAENNTMVKLRNEVVKVRSSPGAPPRAMVVYDKAKPYNPYVFLRGKSYNRGPKVKRRFLQVLSTTTEHTEFKHGSGRLELARAIADEKNPLTARVMVNRIWNWHFGRGIVQTPSNFGILGSVPTHPELLDWMAQEFVSKGWSIKKFHKLLMTSSVYMQKSLKREDGMNKDGSNNLLWRMNPRRLEWEAMRDSLIDVSIKLKHRNGGASQQILNGNVKNCRTIYGFIDRQKVKGAYKYFDFPTPQVTCEARINTVVPQQGLFMMNSKFTAECAKNASAGLKGSDSEKIKSLFRKILSRNPTEKEMISSLAYLKKPANQPKPPKIEYGVAVLKDNLQNFEKFKVSKNGRWQMAQNFPEKEYGFAMLNSSGGHPGNFRAVVRRVTLNNAGVVKVTGMAEHKKAKGNGVRLVVLHNGKIISEWRCHNRTVQTDSPPIEVKAGDRIEIAVDPINRDSSYDAYKWPLKLKFSTAKADSLLDLTTAFNEISKKNTFSVWNSLAQVLMMSNEFLYVD